MFWADHIAEEIVKKKGEQAAKRPLVIRDEKTASGRVHVGSMRGVAVHGLIAEELAERGVPHRFIYEINDFDPMDGLPVYLDEATFRPHMGKPLYAVPSPDPKFPNYAEYFGQEFMGVINDTGFYPEFTRTSELYKSGQMNEVIRTALEQAPKIREIYEDVSNSVKDADWLPISVICEKCGKIGTTKAVSFDGQKVHYTCEPKMVEWAVGCGHEGDISPFDGNAKLPWKVEWAAKFKALGVDIEGAGKDHATKGGARDVADRISREVFQYEPPFDIKYEFFLIAGKKMSSSKGKGASARDIADILPPKIFRLALIGKDVHQQVNFDPEGDTIPVLFDTYDTFAQHYFDGERDDYHRLFQFIHPPTKEGKREIAHAFPPRFSQVAFIVQMPHLNLLEEVEKMKGTPLNEEDKEEAQMRAEYAKKWLAIYAPLDFKFELQTEVPEAAKNFSAEQKKALKEVLVYIESTQKLDGQELHTKLHEIWKEAGLQAQEFFSALYLSFLGKPSGPKAGWFLSVLKRKYLLKRLEEVSH